MALATLLSSASSSLASLLAPAPPSSPTPSSSSSPTAATPTLDGPAPAPDALTAHAIPSLARAPDPSHAGSAAPAPPATAASASAIISRPVLPVPARSPAPASSQPISEHLSDWTHLLDAFLPTPPPAPQSGHLMALADDDGRSEPFDAPRPDPADGAVAAAPTTARAPPALAEGAVVPVRFDASSVALAAGSEGLESRRIVVDNLSVLQPPPAELSLAPASSSASSSSPSASSSTTAADDDATDAALALARCPLSPRPALSTRPGVLADTSTSAAAAGPSRPRPRLPLELQAIIIRDVLSLWRAEDKRLRDGVKRQARTGALAASAAGEEEDDGRGEHRERGGAGRWALVLVCRDWHALAEPDLYRSITLSHPLSYALLAAQLADPTRRPPLQKWIRRAVLRSVPPGWSAAGSAVGGVLGGLRELESLKVRFGEGKGRRAGGAGAQGPEGEGGQAADDDDGAAAGAAAAGEGEEHAPVGVEPSVWAAFPNLNPRIYHQHHLHTFHLPALARAWPRTRVTSSELVFCLTHPPPELGRFPLLPLRSHHLTVFLAGDPSKAHRFARLLSRLAAPPNLTDFRLTLRCPTRDAARAAARAVGERCGGWRGRGWTWQVGFGKVGGGWEMCDLDADDDGDDEAEGGGAQDVVVFGPGGVGEAFVPVDQTGVDDDDDGGALALGGGGGGGGGATVVV